MKTYNCDICGKDFGKQVSIYLAPTFHPNNFTIDNGFYSNIGCSDKDVCNICFDRIAHAQEDIIKQIKKE